MRAVTRPDLTTLLLPCDERFSLLLGSSLMVATAEQLALANDPSFRVLWRKIRKLVLSKTQCKCNIV